MSREKQIEEMAKILSENCGCCDNCEYCGILNDGIDCTEYKYAAMLYNAGYRQQEWISVNERLPDNHRYVLVACEGLTIGGYAQIAIGSYGGGLWSIADADGTGYLTKYMRCVVTHWMPLPESPKKEMR